MTISYGPKLGFMVNGVQGEEHYTQLMAMLRGIDALVQCTVINHTLDTPPGSPSDGDCYIIPTSGASGAWSGQEGKIARYSTVVSAWEFYSPRPGWLAWSALANAHFTHTAAGEWVSLLPEVVAPIVGFTVAQGSCTIDPTDARIAVADEGGFYTSGICRAAPYNFGKRYFELQSSDFAAMTGEMIFGISGLSTFESYNQGAHSLASYSNLTAVLTDQGTFKADSVLQTTPSLTLYEPIGFAVHISDGTMWLYQGGVCLNGDAETGSGGAYYGTSGVDVHPFVTFLYGYKNARIALTDADFAHPPPTGFVAWAS